MGSTVSSSTTSSAQGIAQGVEDGCISVTRTMMSRPSQLQSLAAGPGTALDGGLVVGHPQHGFRLVRDEVGPHDVDRGLDPGPPVGPGAVLSDQVRRRLHQHQQHVDLVRIAVGDDLICRVVGESEAAVGLDDLGMDRIAIPGVDVITVVADVEADGDLAGAGDGLPSDPAGRGRRRRRRPAARQRGSRPA